MLKEEKFSIQTPVIVSGARTPIGSFNGGISSQSSPELGSIAIGAAIDRAGISTSDISEVIMGCVLTGGLGQAPARQAAIGAGISDSVPCMTINKVCGSGMKAVMLAAQSIKLGDSQIVVAGGMESMSNAPYLLDKARNGYRMGNGTLIDSMIHDGLWDPYNKCHMGNCGDQTANEMNFSREQLDEFAAQSLSRAKAAQASGRFNSEIIAVEVKDRKGNVTAMASDEQPSKGDSTKLPGLRPAFDKNGVTTAGNASSINDGAAALIVTSAAYANEHGLAPLATIRAYAEFAHDPVHFTTAPIYAIRKLLSQSGLTVSDIDFFEVNEAFAVVALAAQREIGIPADKLNVNGGAVALGHPIGMTGARLILTAAFELQLRQKRFAVCTPCIGGGEATAVLIESAQF